MSSQNLALRHKNYFAVKAIRISKCRKGSFLLKAGNKFFYWRQTLTSQRWYQRNLQTNLIKLTLVFLVTSSSFTTHKPKLFILSILHRCIVCLPKRYKIFLLWSLLQLFIPLWWFPCTCKKFSRIRMLFSLLNLCQFNF